ncbi:MAG: tryptophan synthase subunit alpha [bacterium]
MNISNYIDTINKSGQKILSVFLTAGYPNKQNFAEIAINVLNAGADMLEIGIPFSDPLADGPVIQNSSNIALQNGTTIKDCILFAKQISDKVNKPIIFMSYINPILNYGIERFVKDAENAGVKGLIIPDLVIEEYNEILQDVKTDLEIILLCTPTTPDERIKQIDEVSNGFVYCVSLNGTTGVRNEFDEDILKPIKNAYQLIIKNKMLVGFGISKPEDVKYFSPCCDGVIVGSAVVKLLADGKDGEGKVIELVRKLKGACKN